MCCDIITVFVALQWSLLVGYLRQTSDGVMALVVDWYSLSLANVLFAWRRDTGLTSTFARVSTTAAAVCLKT